MDKKELVKKMYEKAVDFYKTADMPENYLEALSTVESSIKKFGIEPVDFLRNTILKSVDYERLIYQIMYDLQHGWFISSQMEIEDDAIGQKNLEIALADFLNANGYHFSKTSLNDNGFEKMKTKYNLI